MKIPKNQRVKANPENKKALTKYDVNNNPIPAEFGKEPDCKWKPADKEIIFRVNKVNKVTKGGIFKTDLTVAEEANKIMNKPVKVIAVGDKVDLKYKPGVMVIINPNYQHMITPLFDIETDISYWGSVNETAVVAYIDGEDAEMVDELIMSSYVEAEEKTNSEYARKHLILPDNDLVLPN